MTSVLAMAYLLLALAAPGAPAPAGAKLSTPPEENPPPGDPDASAQPQVPTEPLATLTPATLLPPPPAPLVPATPERPRLLTPVLHAGGIALAMRLSLSALWPEAFTLARPRDNAARLIAAWTTAPQFDAHRGLFESDGDPWTINVVGHALLGSELYQRARRCGHRPWGALAFTAVASAGWEYTIEALHKRPSAIDLVWTPLAGMLLGEGRYRIALLAARKPGLLPLLLLVDPFGELERRLFGSSC